MRKSIGSGHPAWACAFPASSTSPRERSIAERRGIRRKSQRLAALVGSLAVWVGAATAPAPSFASGDFLRAHAPALSRTQQVAQASEDDVNAPWEDLLSRLQRTPRNSEDPTTTGATSDPPSRPTENNPPAPAESAQTPPDTTLSAQPDKPAAPERPAPETATPVIPQPEPAPVIATPLPSSPEPAPAIASPLPPTPEPTPAMAAPATPAPESGPAMAVEGPGGAEKQRAGQRAGRSTHARSNSRSATRKQARATLPHRENKAARKRAERLQSRRQVRQQAREPQRRHTQTMRQERRAVSGRRELAPASDPQLPQGLVPSFAIRND
jgi:hypothetical protein